MDSITYAHWTNENAKNAKKHAINASWMLMGINWDDYMSNSTSNLTCGSLSGKSSQGIVLLVLIGKNREFFPKKKSAKFFSPQLRLGRRERGCG
jgi:hypothetical protein